MLQSCVPKVKFPYKKGEYKEPKVNMCCLVLRTLTHLDHNSKKSILQVEKSGLYSI